MTRGVCVWEKWHAVKKRELKLDFGRRLPHCEIHYWSVRQLQSSHIAKYGLILRGEGICEKPNTSQG